MIDIETMLFQLLHITTTINEFNFPPEIKKNFFDKLNILKCMIAEASNLTKLIKNTEVNDRKKLSVSIKIFDYYKRFRLQNVHQTYTLSRDYQRKIVMVPLKNHYLLFKNTFYEFKNIFLNKIDDLNAGYINESTIDEYMDVKLLDELKFIQPINI